MRDAPTPDGPTVARSFLASLAPASRDRLLALGPTRRYAAGARVIGQGEPCAGLLVVRSGLLKVAKVSAEGREQVLRYVGPDDSFNEVPVFDGGPNAASATAVEPSEVSVISRAAMLDLVESSPDVAGALVQSMAARLRHLTDLVEDLSFRHVSERVARILLQAVAPHGGVGAGAPARGRVTQQELAEMAGTSREVVARALRALEATGAIEVRRGEITLADADRLSLLA